MSSIAPAPLLALPSPFDSGDGTVLLIDEPGASIGQLRKQLLDGTYPRPFVIDDGERRHLHFNLRLTQSVMRNGAPNALEVRYTQKMMAFLLFAPRPRHIVMIGLGGGSLLKFCHHRLPATELTAVELDPDIIALRGAFELPPDGPLLRILCADGAAYVADPAHAMDVLLVDAFDDEGLAPPLARREFLEAARTRLGGNGVLVMNLAGDPERYAHLMDEALAVFEQQVILLPVREDDNQLLIAFSNPRFEPAWRTVHTRARTLRSKYGLDFPQIAEKLERAARQGASSRPRKRR
jgi:spermidine synthase